MPERFRRPPRRYCSSDLGVGTVAIIHSLKSSSGTALNEKRALLIRHHPDLCRWECKVEGVSPNTKALKPDNLRVEAPYPVGDKSMHPDYTEMVTWQMTASTRYSSPADLPRKYRDARGVTYDDDPPAHRARKLVELLDYPQLDGGYKPMQTCLLGEAMKFYCCIPEDQMSSDCTIYHLEHVASLLALAAMCQGEKCHARGCGDGRSEQVLLALLEAAPTSLDVLLRSLVCTPYIGPEVEFTGEVERAFATFAGAAADGELGLTPDQTSDGYCVAMRGPIGVICFIACEDGGARDGGPLSGVFFRVLERHELFPLAVRRLLRLVAREALGTRDGLNLGMYCRNILACVAALDGDLNPNLYDTFREEDSSPICRNAASILLNAEGIGSCRELRDFLHQNIPTLLTS